MQFERGVDIDRTTAPLYAPFAIEYFSRPGLRAASPSRSGRYRNGKLLVVDPLPAGVEPGNFSFRATATYVPDETGTHTFALVQMGGRGRILLDGEVLLDGVADPPGPGTEFFGFASAEALAAVELDGGDARSRWSSSSRWPPTRSSCGASRSACAARHRPICSTAPIARAAAADAVDRDGRHQRRLGDRGRGPRLDGPARASGRARRPGGRRQPATPSWS